MTITTVAPTISATGISAPSYADILAYLQAKYQAIYGADVYLGPDSQDGQFLAVIAQGYSDINDVCVGVYNSFSPATAQGAALSSNVKINGLTRNIASYSTVDLLITGQANTTIANGVVTDASNNRWSLPPSVVIPSSGQITVTATCQTLGAVSAAANTVNTIATPTRGWQSATNPSAAAPGAPVETDSALKSRQTISTARPSQTILNGMLGAISDISGVTRVAAHENDTKVTDADGVPANSIAMVVEGGDAVAIATEIALKKTPGTGTYGTTSESVPDAYGNLTTINFFRPTGIPITVAVGLKALSGYSSTIGAALQQAVSDYVNGVAIGGGTAEAVEWDSAIATAKGISASNTFKITSLTLSGPGGAGTPDVSLAFNEAATCTADSVILTVT